jgi:hypothetical protein
MSDFIAAVIGAVLGSAATIGASAIAYRAVLNVEGGKAERSAIADLMAAAYDLDEAMQTLSAAANSPAGQHGVEDFLRADVAVRNATRMLDRLAHQVRDDELRRLALDLETAASEERVLLYPTTSGPGSARADLPRIRKARNAVAKRAAEVVKSL